MHDGFRILQWAHQNGYTVTQLADKLGYSRQRLSIALHQNDISLSLSKALLEQFNIRITPLRDLSKPGSAKLKKPASERGRKPGAGRGPRRSKLDPHMDAIARLLKEGVSQREIAKRYGTTESNLHNWLKRRGLK